MRGHRGWVPSVLRVDWSDPRAVRLSETLDTEMSARYTGRHDDDPGFAEKAAVAFAVDPADIVATPLALDASGAAVGYAAIRKLEEQYEVKKVVVEPAARGTGVGVSLTATVAEFTPRVSDVPARDRARRSAGPLAAGRLRPRSGR